MCIVPCMSTCARTMCIVPCMSTCARTMCTVPCMSTTCMRSYCIQEGHDLSHILHTYDERFITLTIRGTGCAVSALLVRWAGRGTWWPGTGQVIRATGCAVLAGSGRQQRAETLTLRWAGGLKALLESMCLVNWFGGRTSIHTYTLQIVLCGVGRKCVYTGRDEHTISHLTDDDCFVRASRG